MHQLIQAMASVKMQKLCRRGMHSDGVVTGGTAPSRKPLHADRLWKICVRKHASYKGICADAQPESIRIG